jgi:hypothetical protein
MERLAALEAEVKADADAAQARKAAALAKLREQRVTQTAERDALRARQAELVGKRTAKPAAKVEPAAAAERDLDNSDSDDLGSELERELRGKIAHRARASEVEDLDARSQRSQSKLDELGGAIELASKANRVKHELTRARKQGEKSWIKSGVASLALGPIGWLYAGSMREAVPASAAWIILAAAASKILPAFLLMPVLMVVLPLSAIAGVVYALQYNRSGGRQRLFDGDRDKAKPKQLRDG